MMRRKGGKEKWKLLTRLWSEEAKKRGGRQGEGGVETPDTSLVRRNQGEGGRRKKGKVVWRPLTRLWSGETKKGEKGGAEEWKREGCEGG